MKSIEEIIQDLESEIQQRKSLIDGAFSHNYPLITSIVKDEIVKLNSILKLLESDYISNYWELLKEIK